MFKKILMLSFLSCISFASMQASTYDRECILHMRKDGSAYLELEGHYYECKYVEHCEDCPCYSETAKYISVSDKVPAAFI